MKLRKFLDLMGESLPLAASDTSLRSRATESSSAAPLRSDSATPSSGDTPQRPVIFCITGKMAAGKNFVASKIETELGFVSIDLDKTVHTAIELCTQKIFDAFSSEARKAGIELKKSDGSLDRRALGALIFPRPELLRRQETIVYPKVIELTRNYIEKSHSKNKSVLINATVLFKTPELMNLCDMIIFVTANPVKRFLRAKKRDRLPAKQIFGRFAAQKHLLDEYKKTGKKLVLIKN